MSQARVELEKPGAEQRLLLTSSHSACRIFLPRDKAVVDLISVAQANLNAMRDDTAKSIARDPSHGLLPYDVKDCRIAVVVDGNVGPTLKLLEPNLTALPVPRAAWALLPWLEISPNQELVAMHRNLVLERMEYEVASRFLARSVESLPIDLAVERATDVVRGRLAA